MAGDFGDHRRRDRHRHRGINLMAQKSIYPAEWYPVLELDDLKADQMREFTDDELADYNRVFEEFDAWQKKIRERFGYSNMSNYR